MELLSKFFLECLNIYFLILIKNEIDKLAIGLYTVYSIQVERRDLYVQKNDRDQLLEQANRQRALNAFCSVQSGSYDEITINQLRNIYVMEKYHALYCKIPKVACTNWKKTLLMAADHLAVDEAERVVGYDIHHTLETKYLKTLDEYSQEEIVSMLKSYFKFAFVRHPFDRLVSAYRNKFNNSLNTLFPEMYGTQIIRQYRPSADNDSVTTGKNVTFEEFVRYAIDTHPAKQNEHWQPYGQLCSFCNINYDFIGKYETLENDARFVLNRIGARQIKFPRTSFVKSSSKATNQSWTDVYRSVSQELIHKLWEKYSEDFEMFQYSYPFFTAR